MRLWPMQKSSAGHWMPPSTECLRSLCDTIEYMFYLGFLHNSYNNSMKWILSLFLLMRKSKLKKYYEAHHGRVAQAVGASSCTPHACRFNPQSGHIPGLWVWSLDRVHSGGERLMFLSHIDFLFLFLPSSLSKIQYIYILGWGLKSKKNVTKLAKTTVLF